MIVPLDKETIREGSSADQVFIVVSGLARLVHSAGRNRRVVGFRKSGCVLGAGAALLGTSQPVGIESVAGLSSGD